MRYYDFQKAKAFIDANKERIKNASIGMDEYWFCTAVTVFEDGCYTINLENCKKLAGIDGSYWATPTLEVEYVDGSTEKYNCYIGEREGDCKTPFMMGVVSCRIAAERAAVPRKEFENA